MSARNRVSHVGVTAAKFKGDFLHELLPAVADILWLLDFYKGHAWALEFIRAKTRSTLEARE